MTTMIDPETAEDPHRRLAGAYRRREDLAAELAQLESRRRELKHELAEARTTVDRLVGETLAPRPMPLFDGKPAVVDVPPGQPPGTAGHPAGARTLPEKATRPVEAEGTTSGDWRAIPLNRLMRDREAGEWLAGTYDLHTAGDVYDMERDGDSLNDLGVSDVWREKLRAALLKLRTERGWGPEEGYPAAWLEPAVPGAATAREAARDAGSNTDVAETGGLDTRILRCLTVVPASDVNFRSDLDRAGAATLRAALEQIAGRPGHKGREQAVRGKLKRLEELARELAREDDRARRKVERGLGSGVVEGRA